MLDTSWYWWIYRSCHKLIMNEVAQLYNLIIVELRARIVFDCCPLHIIPPTLTVICVRGTQTTSRANHGCPYGSTVSPPHFGPNWTCLLFALNARAPADDWRTFEANHGGTSGPICAQFWITSLPLSLHDHVTTTSRPTKVNGWISKHMVGNQPIQVRFPTAS